MANLRTILFVLLMIAEIISTGSSPGNEDSLPPLTWSLGSILSDQLIYNLQDSRLTPQYVRMYEDMMGDNQQPKTIDGREDRIVRSGLMKKGTSPHRCNETCPAVYRRRRHITRGKALEDFLKTPDRNNTTTKHLERGPPVLNRTTEALSDMTTSNGTQTTVKPPAPTTTSQVTSTNLPNATSTSPAYTPGDKDGRHELTPPVQLVEETDDDE